MNSKKIVHRIQEQLKERLVKFDYLVNMHVISRKELVTIYIYIKKKVIGIRDMLTKN